MNTKCHTTGARSDDGQVFYNNGNEAGAPPLDCWIDGDPWTLAPPPEGDPPMSRCQFHVGDVFDKMADIPDSSVDLIVTSPPFLALRSYLPADHPQKHLEIGSEATPAAFLTTLLALTREWRRILAPHGSICVELGDTYSGSSSEGGDELRGGRLDKSQSTSVVRRGDVSGLSRPSGPGWPLPKSLCLIPSLYAGSLAYGHNLLDPTDRIEPWRVRNLIVWHRPNPPVGALGDKVRPSTSYITTACTSSSRWFDLDSERTAWSPNTSSSWINGDPTKWRAANEDKTKRGDAGKNFTTGMNPAGAPPLDCWNDLPEDVWTIPTAPYKGAHYATYPPALPRRLIRLMCPPLVCEECGLALGWNRDNPTTTLRGMRGADHRSLGDEAERTSDRPVLFGDMPQPDNGAQSLVDSRVDPRSEGLHLRAGTAASNGEPRGVRHAASPCHGGVVGSVAEIVGSGASHQRREGRQPDREPGSDGQTGTRPEAEASGLAHNTVPSLWRVDPGTESCPRCTGRLRRGRVLDPFAGSGTTLIAAAEQGRDATGIDLDPRNLDLARQRIGLFLSEEAEPA